MNGTNKEPEKGNQKERFVCLVCRRKTRALVIRIASRISRFHRKRAKYCHNYSVEWWDSHHQDEHSVAIQHSSNAAPHPSGQIQEKDSSVEDVERLENINGLVATYYQPVSLCFPKIEPSTLHEMVFPYFEALGDRTFPIFQTRGLYNQNYVHYHCPYKHPWRDVQSPTILLEKSERNTTW